MARRQDTKQGLVDGSNTHGRQQSPLAVIRQPRRTPSPAVFLRVVGVPGRSLDRIDEGFRKLPIAVGQNQGSTATWLEQLRIQRRNPGVHRIRRGLSRQGEEDPLGKSLTHDPISCQHGRFGLAAARQVLEDQQPWSAGSRPRLPGGPLQRAERLTLQMRQQLLRLLHAPNGLRQDAAGGERLFGQRQGSFSPILRQRNRPDFRREGLLVRSQPVAKDGQPGQKPRATFQRFLPVHVCRGLWQVRQKSRQVEQLCHLAEIRVGCLLIFRPEVLRDGPLGNADGQIGRDSMMAQEGTSPCAPIAQPLSPPSLTEQARFHEGPSRFIPKPPPQPIVSLGRCGSPQWLASQEPHGIWILGLEPIRKLAKIVGGEKERHKADQHFLWKPQALGESPPQPAVVTQHDFANRGHVQAVVRQQMHSARIISCLAPVPEIRRVLHGVPLRHQVFVAMSSGEDRLTSRWLGSAAITARNCLSRRPPNEQLMLATLWHALPWSEALDTQQALFSPLADPFLDMALPETTRRRRRHHRASEPDFKVGLPSRCVPCRCTDRKVPQNTPDRASRRPRTGNKFVHG